MHGVPNRLIRMGPIHEVPLLTRMEVHGRSGRRCRRVACEGSRVRSNLGKGWVGFNFRSAFGCPTKVVNDAAMQALGSYRHGKMLFIGLGTGLGSTMIVDGIIEPMELGHLPYKKGNVRELCLETGRC